jgi:carboxypeptidase family protein
METQAYRPHSRPVWACLIAAAIGFGVTCHPRPTILTTSSAAIGGTIAGVLTGPPDAGLGDRTVAVINIDTGQRYETTTGTNGGYSLRVPPGTYRLEVQLRAGEQLAENSGSQLLLKNSDGETGSPVDANANRQQ